MGRFRLPQECVTADADESTIQRRSLLEACASELLPVHFHCPACDTAQAVLAYHDHWKRVFFCLNCAWLWNDVVP